MKPTYAVPVLFLLAVACSDSATAPPAKLSPTTLASLQAGEPPPPPVAAAMVVCVNACVVVDATYFSNGSTTPAAAAEITAAAQTDGTCTFPGPSWLLFHDAATTGIGTPDQTGSAKGKIQCSHLTATGEGTFTIGALTYQIDQIITFENTPTCVAFCASFTATVTLNGQPAGTANGAAFERSYFENQYCTIDESGVPQCSPIG